MERDVFLKQVEELREELLVLTKNHFSNKERSNFTEYDCFCITFVAFIDDIAFTVVLNKLDCDKYKETMIKTFDKYRLLYEEATRNGS